MGYYRAGYRIIGFDIAPQPRYPFEFHRMSWEQVGIPDLWFNSADVVHASPPCQRYSDLAHRNGNADSHPDLIGPVREALIASGLPYVIENVEGAPLRNPLRLCGTQFDGLAVLRHRLFESSLHLVPPARHGEHPLVYTRDKRKAHYGKLDEATSYVSVNGGGNCSVARAREAMGIDWMTKAELNEAVPPAYTEWIGTQIMEHLYVAR
jgi:DNA (cytosine-5)-methyltransferase 1